MAGRQVHREPLVPFPGANERGACRWCGKPLLGAVGMHGACAELWRRHRDYRGTAEAEGRLAYCVDAGRGLGRCDGPIQSDHVQRLVENGPRDWTAGRCRRHHADKTRGEQQRDGARRKGMRVATAAVGGRPGSPWVWLPVAAGSGVVAAGAAAVGVAPRAGVGLGVLWVGCVARSCRRFRVALRRAGRERELRMVAARYADTPFDDLGLVVHEWAGLRPARFTVRYAPTFRTTDPVKRSVLVAELEHATGQRLDVAWRFDEWSVGLARAGSPAEPDSEPVEDPAVVLVREGLGWLMRAGEYTVEAVGEPDGVGLTGLRVRYPSSARDSDDEWRGEVLDVVATKTGQRWHGEWDPAGSAVLFTRRPPIPARVPHVVPAVRDPERVPLATGEHGRVVSWHLIHPHLLLVGKTRSGKTSCILTAVTELLAMGAEVWLCDPKGTTLAGLAALPGVTRTAFKDPAAMNALLVAAEKEIDARYDRIREGVKPRSFRRLVVVVDEAAAMDKRLDSWWRSVKRQGDPRTAPGADAWQNIARMGAEARVHLILAIQQANAKFLDGTEARDNFGARAAFGRLSRESSTMAFGHAGVGRETPQHQGRGVYDVDGGEPVEAQGWWTPDVPIIAGDPEQPAEERAILEPLLAAVRDAQAALVDTGPIPLPAAEREVGAGDVAEGCTAVVDVDGREHVGRVEEVREVDGWWYVTVAGLGEAVCYADGDTVTIRG